MDLRKINLNLLLNLQALLQEKSVTRASLRCFITQSAMSIALNQLRDIFNDSLLVREGKQMRLSHKAKTLIEPLNQIIHEIQAFIEPVDFDPSTSTYSFKIGMSDYAEWVLLPKLLPILKKQAPQIQIQVIHLNALEDVSVFFDEKLDLGIGVLFHQLDDHHFSSENLWRDLGCCVGRANHPLMKKKMKIKDYLKADHLAVIYPQAPFYGNIDSTLLKMGFSRRIKLSTTHMMAGLLCLSSSDLLMGSTMLAVSKLTKAFKLSVSELPFEIPNIVQVKQVWRHHLTDSPEQL